MAAPAGLHVARALPAEVGMGSSAVHGAMATIHLGTAPSCGQTQGMTEDGSGQLRDEAASGGGSAVA